MVNSKKTGSSFGGCADPGQVARVVGGNRPNSGGADAKVFFDSSHDGGHGFLVLACAAGIRPGVRGPAGSRPWWKHAVFYEIYPRSFADSNGDGIGDLNGIASRLDYLKDLGVDAIWITPCYPSPQVDFGYDVSDYENIDPMYGTLQDFDHMEMKRANTASASLWILL